MASNENRDTSFPSDTEVAEGLFITPRVLDHTVFREYSDGLKGLIREASGRHSELRSDAEDARQLCENMTQTAARLRERLETTAKVLPTLDNRVRRAEQALEQAAERATLPEQLKTRIDEEVAQAEAKITRALAEAEARLVQIESRCAALTEQARADMDRIEAASAALDETAGVATQRLHDLSVRADELEAELDARADRSVTRFEERAEILTARSDHVYSKLGDEIDALIASVDGRIALVRQQLAPVVEQVERVPERLRAHIEAAVARIDEHTTEAVSRIAAIEELSTRAVRLIGFDPLRPTDEVAPDSLMMLVQRGVELEEQARQTATELQALHASAAQAGTQIGRVVAEAEGSLHECEAQARRLIAAFDLALADSGSAAGPVMEAIEQARLELEALEVRRSGLVSSIDHTGGDFDRLMAQAVQQLAELRQQATGELARLEAAIAAQKREIQTLSQPKPARSRTRKAPPGAGGVDGVSGVAAA